ncbi:MAG: CIA30 family protein [Cytophagales bacterium]|nr:CIA30 family protein [Cytophagales bacterium]
MTLSSSLSYRIVDFRKSSSLIGWRIVDDVVMGGRSSGKFQLNNEGLGVFYGNVSLENNGGFSSVRYNFKKVEVKNFTKISIRLKGDGKKYQFRIRENNRDFFSYVIPFQTSGNWEEIELDLKDMYPSFRGRKLDKRNFHHDSFEEIAFLIANKRAESFQLIIDNIELR